MIKSNTKKARENIRAYIRANYNASNYSDLPQNPETFGELSRTILDTFQAEKYYSLEEIKKQHIPMLTVFTEWASGLPSILDTCYYYNRSAVDDLGWILEETETEKAKYSESQACDMLTRLIYRELVKGANEK